MTELNEWGQRVLQKMRTIPQVVDVSSDQQNKGLQATLMIDRATASRLGITPQLIDNTLYDAFGQRQVSINYTLLNQYHVVMEVEPRFWQRPDTLKSIYVPSSNGPLVPLSAFTHYEPTATSLAVNHQGQFPSVTTSSTWRPAWRSGTRSRRSKTPRARWACRRASGGPSRAPPRHSRTPWPISRF